MKIKVLLNINGKTAGSIIPAEEPWSSWAKNRDTADGGRLICEPYGDFDGLDERIVEALKEAGYEITGLKELVKDKDAFIAIKGLGERSYNKVLTWLTERGEL